MDEPAEWDQVERRVAQQPLPPGTIEVLTKNHEAIADVAVAMRDLGNDLVDSQKRQSRGMVIWMMVLSVAVVIALAVSVATLVFSILNARQGRDNFEKLSTVATCIEVGGECFDRIEEREKAVTDADRRLLAQEIVCYVTSQCPPGMTPENIPDLADLPPPEEDSTPGS